MKKITKNKKKNSGGCEEWMCTLCNHVFKGSYTRVWHHLLSISGDGVKGCTCKIQKMMELTKLHMASLGSNVMNLDNDCNFKVPRSLSHDIEDLVNENASNQFVSVGGVHLGGVRGLQVFLRNKFLKSRMYYIGMRLMMLLLNFSWKMEFHLILPVLHTRKKWCGKL